MFLSLVSWGSLEEAGQTVSPGGGTVVLEVEYLLLPRGLGGEVLLLLAGLVRSLQAALLEVLEAGSYCGLGAFGWPRGRTGTLGAVRHAAVSGRSSSVGPWTLKSP